MRVITAVNHEQIDLNLLKVFNAVMTELHVTRAAQYLHMTQPAVSNALNRLRLVLKDELFIKVPSGVRPTAKALEIWPPIREALSQIRQSLEAGEFDPKVAQVTFTIGMNDLVASLFLPRLIMLLETSAPGITIHTIPTTNSDAGMLLEQADLDLAIGVFSPPSSRLRSRSLLTSAFTAVMRRDHPLADQPLTLERYVTAEHLLVTLTGEASGFMDILLQEYSLERHIRFTVNQFSMAPQIIAHSDLLAVLPTKIIDMSSYSSQLHLTSPPIEISPSTIKMMWHERNHLDPAQAWLRSQLLSIC